LSPSGLRGEFKFVARGDESEWAIAAHKGTYIPKTDISWYFRYLAKADTSRALLIGLRLVSG